MPERPIETLEPADGGGQFVLVVDDEPSLRHLLAFHIAREGHRVVEAATAAEALASAQRQPPDLVLLDLQLPEADALELLAALRRRLPDVPVIALASPDEPAKGIEALRGGAHDLLEKPFDVARLGIAVRNALRVSRLARQVDALRRELLACDVRTSSEAILTGPEAAGLSMTPPGHEASRRERAGATALERGGTSMVPPVAPLEEIERVHILRTIETCRGNLSQAARLLDIGRTTLYRKLQRYGVTGGDGGASSAYL